MDIKQWVKRVKYMNDGEGHVSEEKKDSSVIQDKSSKKDVSDNLGTYEVNK